MDKDKLINKILFDFQQNKGKSSCYCFDKDIVVKIINKVICSFRYKQGEDIPIFIVVDKYNTRQAIIYDLLNNNINKDNIKILSEDYVNIKYHYPYKLIITVGINENYELLEHLCSESKFTLSIITKNTMNVDFINKVRTFLPCIETAELHMKNKLDKIYSPVEEHRIGVELSDNDKETYDKYTDYINTSISIFGSLDNIEKCKHGDSKLNISSAEFRNNIAKENGWREDLDTTIPFIKQIDETYNPNILYERACNFYTITKQRRDLVSDNDSKLESILKVIKNNPDKRILIISKRAEYANKITKYLINNDIKCGDYHDCIDDAIAVDINGDAVYYKYGDKKGQVKIIGSQAQSTLNEKLFNLNQLNVLSVKNTSNNKLKIACDIVIFTSSLCDSIFDIKQRFMNITFRNNPTIIYKIYCMNTLENDKLNNSVNTNIIKVINENEDFIEIDEKNGCIIL